MVRAAICKLASMLVLLVGVCFAVAGDKSYRNPILCADYSDPDVIRAGEDYYMISSSFNMMPGIAVLHSRDLVHWRIINHVYERLPDAHFTYRGRTAEELSYDKPVQGKGCWAPCLRYHDGWFYVFFGDPDAGVYMSRTKDPAGKWSRLHLVHKAHGVIDTSPLWDKKTRRAWLAYAYAASRAGVNGQVMVQEMSWDASRLIGEPKIIFDNFDPNFKEHGKYPTIEGCKFMQRNGYYYIFCPANGVEKGNQAALRATRPDGPYEIRTICETGKTNINGPHQGGLVDTPNGEWWFIHFQSVGTLGRIVRMEPAKWADDWPVIGIDADGDGIGNPVEEYRMPNVGKEYQPVFPQMSDAFEEENLGLQWQWPANPKKEWYTFKDGHLVLFAQHVPDNNLGKAANLLTQKFPAYCFTATAKVCLDANNMPDVQTGLGAYGKENIHISVRMIERNRYRISVFKRTEQVDLKDVDIPDNVIYLRMSTRGKLPLPYKGEESGQCLCQFSYSIDGFKYEELGPRMPASEGVWMGARIALFCIADRPSGKGSAAIGRFDLDIQSLTGLDR